VVIEPAVLWHPTRAMRDATAIMVFPAADDMGRTCRSVALFGYLNTALTLPSHLNVEGRACLFASPRLTCSDNQDGSCTLFSS
jgi:hypothetical protein